jgi:NAD(P)-dependent dehydrogenase (short-subunit alcohol dehydrogenase family)
MKLQGQIAVITGATRGIGRAIARAMAGEGAGLVLAARTASTLEALSEELVREGAGRRVIGVPGDVTVPEQADALVRAAVNAFGGIDILVNNVGRGLRKPFIETTDEEWRHQVDINLSSAFYVSRAALPHMLGRRRGLIINIASRAGVEGRAELAAYSAVKGGLIGLTRALAKECGEDGIRVNVVCPGPVRTERMKGLLPHLKDEEWLAPEDVAEAVLLIATSPGHTMQGRTLELF